MRLCRDTDNSDFWYRKRENVTKRWKEKGLWKESRGDQPGWKWRHESPSSEPADPNDMEFTPSEIDALEEIPPPTPRPSPKLSSLEHRDPTWSNIFGWSHGYKGDPPPFGSVQPAPDVHAGSNSDHEGNGPGTPAEHTGEEPPQGSVEINAIMAPREAHEDPPSPARSRRRGGVRGKRSDRSEQAHRPTTQRATRPTPRPTGSLAQAKSTSPIPRATRPRQQTSRAPTASSKIHKPTPPPPRRSARIAARQ